MIDMLSYKFFFLKIPVWGTSLPVPVVKTLHSPRTAVGQVPSLVRKELDPVCYMAWPKNFN